MKISEMCTSSAVVLFIVLLNNAVNGSELLSKTVDRLSGILPEISIPPLIPPNPHGHCLKLQCKFICFNGQAKTIESDVHAVNDPQCMSINELHVYNYDFPQKTIPEKFLGNISDYVNQLFIYSSDVESIDEGAFESQTLTSLHLEGLNLKGIYKSVFEKVSSRFTSFVLIQKDTPLESVGESFLGKVKYQIKKLTIQTGLVTVENLTNSACLLNSLEDVDLSFNNFAGHLKPTSFKQLSMVENLNLTNSNITYLPESIFADMMGTIKSLDLSSNKLKFITQKVFGWRTLDKALVIYLNGNPWECSCELRNEMLKILLYQTEKVYCEIPKDVLVTDDALCATTDPSWEITSEPNSGSGMGGNSVPQPPAVAPTDSSKTTESGFVPPSNSVPEDDLIPDANGLVKLECHKTEENEETDKFSIEWPNVQFDIVKRDVFEVDIEVRSNLNGSYGILWFSKVTTQYYKMEVNYKDYGLGCYGVFEYVTTVENLLPDMAYTFCLVLKGQLTVSPFSCKSVYIGGNLDVKYNAWLSKDMKATGLTLVILGIVLFNFLGILFIFLLIKQKPTLVKGSKRVVTQKNDSTNIIVFPEDKTLQKFKLREEQLAKRNSRGSFFRRTSSVSLQSMESNQSYMNSNLYEVIPAYQRYLPTFNGEIGLDVSYAEVPFKRKRTSNDPLPAVPSTSTSDVTKMKLEIITDYFLDPEGTSV